MKKVAGVVILVIVVLLGVAAVRAARMPSLQPPASTAEPSAWGGDSEAAVERFAGALRIPTISLEDTEAIDSAAFRRLHAYLDSVFPAVHAALKRETIAGLSLLYTWEGTDPELPPLVLMGHQDVVPVIPGTEGDWTHPPFEGVVADGYVWGRGSADDKASVLAILEAAEDLARQGHRPRRTIYFAFGHDEEVGGVRGASAIAATLEERGAEPYAMVIDEGGAVARDMIPGLSSAVAMVGVAEKGYVNLELRVRATGGHSSTPPQHTAIGILAEAVSELEENPFPMHLEGPVREMFRYLAPEMSFVPRMALGNLWLFGPVLTRMLGGNPSMAAMLRTTTAVTIVEGGVKANVLPIEARAVVNHRIRPGETIESVLERVRSVIDDERVEVRILGGEGVNPSPVSDPSTPAFQLLGRTIRETLSGEDVVVTPYLVMGGTDAKYYSGRSNAVFRFLPVVMEADALERVHGTDERMPVEGYLTSVRFFRRLMVNVDEL